MGDRGTGLDLGDPRVVSVFDELPLWSAPSGLRLLERVRFRTGLTLLDLGCGAGFPLLELAQRLGPTSRAVGVDPWEAGLRRAQDKARAYGAAQVHLVRAVGEQLPLRDRCIDLVVSNNGLNNVPDPETVLRECFRVCRPGAQLVATMNLPETMREFYRAFEATLLEVELGSAVAAMERHIHEKRKPQAEVEALLRRSRFEVEAVVEDEFTWRFLDGRALFRHFFVRLGFLEAWEAVVPEADVARVFTALEARLDQEARRRGELRLAVPFVCFDCRKA